MHYNEHTADIYMIASREDVAIYTKQKTTQLYLELQLQRAMEREREREW